LEDTANRVAGGRSLCTLALAASVERGAPRDTQRDAKQPNANDGQVCLRRGARPDADWTPTGRRPAHDES
jgi:hypothetical protein